MNERDWDKRLHIRTIGREEESNANYAPYEPTPYCVLERLAQSGLLQRKQHLLDYGCGKGRVAFFMADTVGCRVTGIDQSSKLIEIAKENRKTSRLGDRITFSCNLAEQYEITTENAFFFFNPFSVIIFEGVLRRLHQSWTETPRPMRIFCYYPSEEYIAALDAMPSLLPVDTIDCRDMFSKKNPRERIVIYDFTSNISTK